MFTSNGLFLFFFNWRHLDSSLNLSFHNYEYIRTYIHTHIYNIGVCVFMIYMLYLFGRLAIYLYLPEICFHYSRCLASTFWLMNTKWPFGSDKKNGIRIGFINIIDNWCLLLFSWPFHYFWMIFFRI